MTIRSAWSFALCAVLVAIVPAQDPLGARPVSEVPPEQRYPEFFGEHWFGLYVLGRKIGTMQLTAVREAESGEYSVTTDMTMVDASSGESVENRMSMVRRYAGHVPYPLIGGHDRTSEGGTEEILRLHREPGGTFRIETISAGKSSEQVGLTTKEVFSTGFAVGRIEDIALGYTEEYSTLNFEKGRDEPTRVSLLKRETKVVKGVSVETLTFKMSQPEQGMTGTCICDSRGMPIKFQFMGIIEARLETRDVARDVDRSVDLMTEMLVPMRGLSVHEDELKTLTLEWRGADELLAHTATQGPTWRTKGRVQTLVLSRAAVPDATEQAAPIPADVKPYLAANGVNNSDHPDLVKVATGLVAGASDRWAAVQAINAWVDTSVEDALSANSLTARSVLSRLEGDCTEHTLLAIALLRAAGIPAREISGVIYVDELRAMGWHAWLEVWVGRWIPIDPTWGQAPASLGRVVFMVEGDPSAQLSATSKMRARVVDVQKKH